MPGPYAPTIPPSTVSTSLGNASTATGVPVSTLTAIANNESSYGQNPNVPLVGAAGEQGFMQMTPGAIDTVNQQFGTSYTPADMQDPATAALASAQYTSYLTNYYGGDTNAAIAAYNAGQGNVNNVISTYGSVTPQTLAEYTDATGHAVGTSEYLQNAQNSMGTSGASSGSATAQTNAAAIGATTPPSTTSGANADPVMASVIPQASVSQQQIQDVQPPLVIVDGLGNQPWFQDTNLLTGNPRLQKQGVFPITFQIFLNQDDPTSYLTNTGMTTGTPISIPLNCSLQRHVVSSRHVINRAPTRTGFHVTMWGMAPDIISGSGVTGVFMNKFGLTDFLSFSGAPSDAINAALGDFSHSPSSAVVQTVGATPGSGNAAATALVVKTPVLSQLQQAAAQQSSNAPAANLTDAGEPFRIAAADAFQELLALFKMNATTWLHPSGYGFDSSGKTTDTANQNQTALYSPQVGANDFEIKARNNDVYRRGYVVMTFRNTQYLGFFQALSFDMDAEKPFMWRFSFTFKVERTLALVYFSTTAQPPAANVTTVGAGLGAGIT